MDGRFDSFVRPGFTLIVLDADLLAGLQDLPVTPCLLQPGSEAAQVLGAGPQSAYLVRPDMHVAARMMVATPAAIRRAYAVATAGEKR